MAPRDTLHRSPQDTTRRSPTHSWYAAVDATVSRRAGLSRP